MIKPFFDLLQVVSGFDTMGETSLAMIFILGIYFIFFRKGK
jgi:cbb3-type cytochrome oxidase subunit 3